MNSIDTKPAASDGAMFGCECALPFLTGLPGSAVRTGAMSAVALGALMAFSACDASFAEDARDKPTDKVSAAFDKVDRQVERAKARLKKADRHTKGVAEAAAMEQR